MLYHACSDRKGRADADRRDPDDPAGDRHQACVAATYNRQRHLAPHVLFMKNDALHVGGVTLERDGEVPKEYKMGVFKLDGLGEIAITDRPFQTSELWDPADERFAADALMTVER